MPLDHVPGFDGTHEIDGVQERLTVGAPEAVDGPEMVEQALFRSDPSSSLVDEVSEHTARVEVRVGQHTADFGQRHSEFAQALDVEDAADIGIGVFAVAARRPLAGCDEVQ